MTKPHGCRLRHARCSVPGRLYMLTTVTHLRQPLFQNLHHARLAIHNLRHADQQQHCRSLAWVLMPDHLHWLIELKDATLSKLMQRFKCQSSNALRKAGVKMSPIWQQVITTALCAETKIFSRRQGISWPTRSGRDWLPRSVITRIGMRFGFEGMPQRVAAPGRLSTARAAHRELRSLLRLFRASKACGRRARPPCL